MKVQRQGQRQKQAAPLHMPHAATGRADLLRFMQIEPHAALRQQAAALLGLPPLPLDLFVAPQLLDLHPFVPPNAAKANAAKLPLRCPVLLHAMLLPVDTPDAGTSGGAGPGTPVPWTSDDADDVEAMLLPPGLQPPLPMPLVPLARRAGQVGRALRQPAGPALDWPALLRRVAHAQLLWPLPTRRLQRAAHRLVVLIDASPALHCFDDDFWGLATALGAAQGWAHTEVWFLPQGPTEVRQPAWEQMAQRPWDKQTALLLLSDLGAGRPALELLWRRHLRQLRRHVARLVAITPCASHQLAADVRRQAVVVPLVVELTPTPASPAEQLHSLLAALAPALTVEPSLVRALRLALWPGSSPLLEREVWRHADLVGGLPFRQWLPQRQRVWLESRGGYSASWLQRVSDILRSQHAHCCQVQQDEETMLLAAWALSQAPAQAAALPEAFIACASEAQARCTRVARHLLHLEQQAGGHGTAVRAGPAHSAGSAAQGRLQRMPLPLQVAGHAGANDLFAAQAQHQLRAGDRVLEVPPGVTWVAPPPSPEALPLALEVWQQGQSLWLTNASANAPALASGVRLLAFELKAGWFELEWQGSRKWRATAQVPWPLLLCSGGIANGQRLQLRWQGGGMEVQPVARPRGACGWALEEKGITTTLQPPLARAFVQSVGGNRGVARVAASTATGDLPLPWLPHHPLTFDEAGFLLQIFGPRFGILFGFDGEGAYADLVGPLPDAVAVLKSFPPVLQRLRYIEPGTFLMGSPPGEAGRDQDEGPQHPVTITQGFWLADTPCTQALWLAVMGGKNPSYFEDGPDAEQRPVDSVSWDDVQTFLRRLGAALPVGSAAALPTEAEWEYAARAGTTTAYAWGDEPDPQRTNVRESEIEQTAPVKRYAANDWGLYDMHGNVWEWCADAFRGYRNQPEVDPSGGTEGDSRVLRGGSWIDPAARARSAYRDLGYRGDAWRRIGFRLALRSPSPGPGGPGSQEPGGPLVLAGRRPARAAGSSPSPAEPGGEKKPALRQPPKSKKP